MSYSKRNLPTLNSYFKAQSVLRNRDRRKLCNNTYLVRSDTNCIGVLLHNTYIIKYFESGRIVLNTNGWETVTTKQRLNALLDQGIFSEKGQWIIKSRNGYYIYEDGMEIDRDGFPNTKPLPGFQLEHLTGGEYKTMDEFVQGLRKLSIKQVKHIIRFQGMYWSIQEHIALHREDAIEKIVRDMEVSQIERMLSRCHKDVLKAIIKLCDKEILPLLINRGSEVCDRAIEQRLREVA